MHQQTRPVEASVARRGRQQAALLLTKGIVVEGKRPSFPLGARYIYTTTSRQPSRTSPYSLLSNFLLRDRLSICRTKLSKRSFPTTIMSRNWSQTPKMMKGLLGSQKKNRRLLYVGLTDVWSSPSDVCISSVCLTGQIWVQLPSQGKHKCVLP